MIPPGRTARGLALLLAALMPLHAEASMEEPFELMRTLRVLQDEVAKGDTGAHNAQQQVMSELSRQLTAIAPEFWKEPRNLRAAALYVFGGGDPGVLRTILGFGGLPQPEAELARGALAYAEGRDEEARTLLLPIDARELDPGIAGTVALVQSTLIAKVDPEKAMSLLDQARLLSPGTLVEESALRRQVLLMASSGRLDGIEPLLSRYVRQFGKSHYARAFWRQLSSEIAGLERPAEMDWLTTLERILEPLEVNDRRYVYESLAQEGTARGNVELVRFASTRILEMTHPEETDAIRAHLYKSAALVVTDEYERSYSMLARLSREKLVKEDAELLSAALSVAHEIRRPPALADSSGKAAQAIINEKEQSRTLSSIGSGIVERARALVARVDALLGGGAR